MDIHFAWDSELTYCACLRTYKNFFFEFGDQILTFRSTNLRQQPPSVRGCQILRLSRHERYLRLRVLCLLNLIQGRLDLLAWWSWNFQLFQLRFFLFRAARCSTWHEGNSGFAKTLIRQSLMLLHRLFASAEKQRAAISAELVDVQVL